MVYLDYAATTPLNDEVLNAYTKLLKQYYGNSDSLHALGREAANLMETAREQISDLLSVRKEEVLFTSCASEANNLALKGYAFHYQKRGKHLITTAVEHSSVLHTMEQLEKQFGFEVSYLPVNEQGKVELESLKQALRKDTILVSCMLVNNESGAINDISVLADYVHAFSRAAFHMDGVQGLGKVELPLDAVDMATFSAHKIYGLKGSGLLIKKQHVELLPLISAGQQEQGLRGGTSNSPVNTVFAKTLRLALEKQAEHTAYVKGLNDYLREELAKLDHIIINSDPSGSPYILNFSCLKIGSEIMLNALDERGFCVSAQSTCASHTKAHSYVLSAMGLGEVRATHAVRVSLSHLTKQSELTSFIEALKEIIHDYQIR